MKIALKGNIGSGKTTVSNYLSDKYGFYHFNCDYEVGQLYKNNHKLIKDVNHQILGIEENIIDKEKLKKVVFNDKEKLQQLESLVYPYLKEKINSINNNKIVFDCQQIEKLNLNIDHRLYIDINVDIEMKRVSKRDNRNEEEINKIIKIQNKEKKKYDYIIYNNKDINDLYQQIDDIYRGLDD